MGEGMVAEEEQGEADEDCACQRAQEGCVQAVDGELEELLAGMEYQLAS